MKKNVKILSESYSQEISIVLANIVEKDKSETMFKFVIEQGNCYNNADVYIRTKNKDFKEFVSFHAVPQLKFNTTYIYDDEERIADHKKIMKKMIGYISEILMK